MSKLRKQSNNDAEEKHKQAEMKREEEFQRLVTLRKKIRDTFRYFGQSKWEGPAKDVLDNDESTVEDFVEALEKALAGYMETDRNNDYWRERDRLGWQERMEEVLALAENMLPKIQF